MTEKLLTFTEANHPDLSWGFEVYNKKEENICGVYRSRTGRFVHWCMIIEERHLGGGYVQISPGCQDEIRGQCKILNRKI